MAQKRLTAVGRVFASVSQTTSNGAPSSNAERDAHGGSYADGRGAADDHVADGGGYLLVSAAGDELFFERQARLIDHHGGAAGPLNGLNH